MLHVGDTFTVIEPGSGRPASSRSRPGRDGLAGERRPRQPRAHHRAVRRSRTSSPATTSGWRTVPTPMPSRPRVNAALPRAGSRRRHVHARSATRERSKLTGFLALLRGFLGFGLLVGIAGLGVVMVRAVRERRQEIGMLRAMGFRAGLIRTAMLSEAGLIAVQGTVIGAVLGLITTRQLLPARIRSATSAIPFIVPWVGCSSSWPSHSRPRWPRPHGPPLAQPASGPRSPCGSPTERSMPVRNRPHADRCPCLARRP